MKHFAMYFGIAAALVASCTVEKEDLGTLKQEDATFYASLEQPGVETRVYANEELLLRWTANDRVSIFNQNTYNQEYKFLGATGDVEGGFTKVDGADFVTGNSIAHVVSVYPFLESSRITEDEVLTVALPAEQHYAENTFGLGANTMVSVTANNNLKFKNAGGFLRLKLYGEGVSVSAITLKGNNGEKLAGNATISMPFDGVPSLEMASDATTEITLVCETPVELGATAEESKVFWIVVPPVTFSKGFTISVNEFNGGVFEKSTSKNLAITRSNVSTMAAFEVAPVAAPYPVPEMVDLGLSVKWASFNLGASAPEEYGDYYAWGETEPHYMPGYAQSSSPVWKEGKEGYIWSSYQWSVGSYLTKYCNDPEKGNDGFTDQKTVLDPEDDAATVHLGDEWRIPTFSEFKELALQCTWEWVTVNGINGRKVTGPNGNSIFLPAAGYRGGRYGLSLSGVGSYGHYAMSLYDPTIPTSAWTLYFNNSKDRTRYSESRCYGMSIRPVYGKLVSVEGVSLNYESLTMQKGGTETLTAVFVPSNATEKKVLWSSDNYAVASVSEVGVVEAKSAGTATIVAKTVDGGYTAECVVTVLEYAVPEMVDLGLSVKWASFNLGASRPEEYGEYYAWAEMAPYYESHDPLTWKEGKENGYYWPSYRWSMGTETSLTKYCTLSSYGYEGFKDNKATMEEEDDVAHCLLGGSWRIPTESDFQALLDNCTTAWTQENGVNGYKFTSRITGKSIFLPAEGIHNRMQYAKVDECGYYWSSTLRQDAPHTARYLFFESGQIELRNSFRYNGFSIRPVCD